MTPITVKRETTEELHRAGWPSYARMLEGKGWQAVVTLRSEKAGALAYQAGDGQYRFVHGSLPLFKRWQRESEPA